MLIAVAKDFVIQLKSGEEARIPVENIKDIRFDGTTDHVQLPEDPPYPTSTDFTRKVLLTQHTGTNCGYCPKMVMALRTVAADDNYKDAFTLAALHSYDNDPMGTDLIREVSKPYTGAGYPFTNINWKNDGVGALRNYNLMADKLKQLIDGEMTATVPSGIASPGDNQRKHHRPHHRDESRRERPLPRGSHADRGRHQGRSGKL